MTTSPNMDTPLRGVQAIESTFLKTRRQNRLALITYLTLGYPSYEASLELVPLLEAGGADIIELGVPFSDPVADGPIIQRASQAALQAGMQPARCLELVLDLRKHGLKAPALLMGYYNPILSWGVCEFVRDCVSAGVDGLIVPDLPPEEATELRDQCHHHGIALVFLVAPTTENKRMRYIAQATSGFLYVVSRLGVTGITSSPNNTVCEQLASVNAVARTPVAVGFGISHPEHVLLLKPLCDGVIVGSSIVEAASRGPEALRNYMLTLREAL